jgi:CubicO group peptidase (beta-lactamase class C family)
MSSGRVIAHLDKEEIELLIEGSSANLPGAESYPLDSESSFDLGSITKILATTTLAMQLVDRGELVVTEAVSRFLPDWNSSEKSEITIEDLLRHEAGLEEWRPFYISCQSSDEALQLISQLPLKYPAKKEFHYSDLSFITLGKVIESIYSQRLDQIFLSEVAQPWGLTSTNFARPVSQKNVVATSIGDSIEEKMVESKIPYNVPEKVEDFSQWRKGILQGEVNDGNAFHLFHSISGHAGLFSNAQDLIKYSREIFQSFSGQGRITAKTIKLFTTSRHYLRQGMGFKLWPIEAGRSAFGHFGFPGVGIALDPERSRALIYLTNRIHTGGKYAPMEEIWRDHFEKFAGIKARGD